VLERADPDQVVIVRRRLPNFRIVIQRPAERERRDDDVHAAAVREAGVDHRRRLVDAPADLGHDLVDDPAQVRVVVEPHVRLVEAALALDPDVVGAVDHDLGHAVVCEEPLERAVAERVVGDLVREAARGRSRERPVSGMRCWRMSVRTRSRSGLRVHRDVEELRAELADHRQVDAILQLGERIAAGRLGNRTRRVSLSCSSI
jgi:hypothetical protein